MRSFSCFTAALAISATSAWAQNAPVAVTNAPVQLEVAVRGYAADDRARSMAGDSAMDKVEGYVWADRSLCGMGAGSASPVATPWVGWHFVGTVQGVTPDSGRASVTFRVEWQRMWENGAKVAEGSKGVSSTSLREGERLELDRVTGGGTEGCGVTQARLEVSAVARPTYRLAVGNMLNNVRTARAGGRGAAPAPQATTGAATGTKVIAPKIEAYKEELVKQLQDRTFKRGFFQLPGTYDAELWLVHRHPDGKETTELKKVQFTGADLAFTFPAVVVTTSKGDLSIDFSGTLRAGVGPDAASFPSGYLRSNLDSHTFTLNKSATDLTGIAWRPSPKTGSTPIQTTAGADNAVRIAVTIARRARASFTPPLDLRGGSYFFMNVPAPDDVISFEFPSLPQGTEDLLKGHTFSLRIRVTPVAK